MDVNKILSADILDIIFEGRNKTYGAYELRKTYNHRLRNALLATAALCLLLFLGSILANTIGSGKDKKMNVQDVQLEEVKQEEKLQEAFKDEYWAKKYDVTLDELKKVAEIGISALIIESGKKHKAFAV